MRLPEKKSGIWILVLLVTVVAAWGLAFVGSLTIGLLDDRGIANTSIIIILAYLPFFFIVPFFVALFGGRRFFIITASAGLASAIMAGAITNENIGGWEAFGALFLMVAVGIAATVTGIIVELIHKVRREKGVGLLAKRIFTAAYAAVLLGIALFPFGEAIGSSRHIIGNPDFVTNIDALDGLTLEEAMDQQAHNLGIDMKVELIAEEDRKVIYMINDFCQVEHYTDDYIKMKFMTEQLGSDTDRIVDIVKVMILVTDPDLSEEEQEMKLYGMLWPRESFEEDEEWFENLEIVEWPEYSHISGKINFYFLKEQTGIYEIHIEDARMGH